MKKIGILGGSFDPVHLGHKLVASYASEYGGLDEVWVMVNRQNPLKASQTRASEQERLEMCRLAMEGCKKVRVSDFELSLPVPSYTYDTLVSLKKTYPGYEFKFLIGSDSLANFNNWKNSGKILEEFGVMVYPRPGYEHLKMPGEGFEQIEGMPVCGISSTFVRDICKKGWDLGGFVPEKVSEFIVRHGLYGYPELERS